MRIAPMYILYEALYKPTDVSSSIAPIKTVSTLKLISSAALAITSGKDNRI